MCDITHENHVDLRQQVREIIREKMGVDEKEAELPVVAIGKGEENYTNALIEFNEKIVSTEKYNCQSIKSPIDKMQENETQLQNVHNQLASQVNNLTRRVSTLQGQIQATYY